jgi:photosystem II stability/assembly factor-like uncharacterized protein
MGRIDMRIRLNPILLVLAAALPVAALVQSCVGDTAKPEEEPSGWIDVPAPPVVRIDANAIAVDRHGTLFMGGDYDAPLWRSTDRGATWTQKTAGLITRRPVTAFLVKGGETVFAALEQAGVFISRNRGESWTQVNNHLTDLSVRSLVAAADGSIVAGTSNGKIFRSSNDGGVWVEVQGHPIWAYMVALAADSAGIIYAGSLGQGVFCSADNGLTWTPSSNGLESLFVLALAIDDEGNVLAGTWANGVYRSAGPGAPWERIDGGAVPADVSAIAIDESGAIFAGTHGRGVFRSPDGGYTWERADIGLQGLEIESILCANGVLLAGTSQDGVFRSTDGGSSWSLPRNYYPADPDIHRYVNQRESLSVDSCGTYYLLTELTIYRSRDAGVTWTRASGDISERFTCLVVHPNSSLLAGTWRGIYVSNDSGDSWSIADTSSAGIMTVYALEVARNGTVFGWTDKGVLRFADGCSSWEPVFVEENITAIGTGSAGRVYVGTFRAGAFASNDYGDTWRRMTDSLRIHSIEADRVGNVFVSSPIGILCSGDEGETWRTIDLDGEDDPPTPAIPYYNYGMAVAPGGEIAIAYGTPEMLYISEDCFSSWKTETVPFGYISLCLSPGGYLFAVEQNLPVIHRSRNALY